MVPSSPHGGVGCWPLVALLSGALLDHRTDRSMVDGKICRKAYNWWFKQGFPADFPSTNSEKDTRRLLTKTKRREVVWVLIAPNLSTPDAVDEDASSRIQTKQAVVTILFFFVVPFPLFCSRIPIIGRVHLRQSLTTLLFTTLTKNTMIVVFTPI